MAPGSSVNKNQQAPKSTLQRLAAPMVAFLVFVFLGGAWIIHNDPLSKPSGITSLTAPKSGQKIWIKNQESVLFKWVGAASPDSILEVSRDREFRDLVLKEIGPSSPYLTDKLPGDGDYFYRIVERNSDQTPPLLPPISFTIITQDPPPLIYPFSPMTFSEAKPLRFYWQGKHGVNHYRFQIAFDKSFQNLFTDLLVNETQTIPQTIPRGHFFWRVRGEGDSAASTQWSEVRVLQSESNLDKKSITPPPTVTTLASPKVAQVSQKTVLHYPTGSNLRNQVSALNPPLLSWSKSKDATTYEVQISKKADFSHLEWTKSTPTLETKWDLATPGKFFWRVQAVNDGGVKSPFSSTNKLYLTLPAPKMKKLFSHKVEIKTRAQLSEPSPVAITWTDVPAASSYRILVSENKKFNSPIMDLSAERNLASLNIDQKGRYFVKVAALGIGEELASDYSEVSIIDYEKKNLIPKEKPQPTPQPTPKPTPVPVEKKASLPAPQPKLPPDGVSIVALNGSQDPILFKWENTSADIYHIEIAADAGFQQILHSTDSKENQLVVTRILPKGKLYWHLRAQKSAVRSEWSPTFSFEFAK